MNTSIEKFGLCLFLMITIFTTTCTVAAAESTSLWDIIPGTSQLKSVFQLIVGDLDGAKNTQINFLNEGLGPAQARSAYFLITGEPKKALDVQGKFFSNLEVLVDGTPLIGHIKGGIHLLAGDHDHGWHAIKSATSTVGTVLGAAVLGPVGAIGGHIAMDSAITATDYILNGDNATAYGVIDYFHKLSKKDAGEHFDAIAGLAFDGWAGGKAKTKKDSFMESRTKTDAVRDHGLEMESYRTLQQRNEADGSQGSQGLPLNRGSSISQGSLTSFKSLTSQGYPSSLSSPKNHGSLARHGSLTSRSSQVSQDSLVSQGMAESQGLLPSHKSPASQGSLASHSSLTSHGFLISQSSQASQGSLASHDPSASLGSPASQGTLANQGLLASHDSLASQSSPASQGSSANQGSSENQGLSASQGTSASHGSFASLNSPASQSLPESQSSSANQGSSVYQSFPSYQGSSGSISISRSPSSSFEWHGSREFLIEEGLQNGELQNEELQNGGESPEPIPQVQQPRDSPPEEYNQFGPRREGEQLNVLDTQIRMDAYMMYNTVNRDVFDTFIKTNPDYVPYHLDLAPRELIERRSINGINLYADDLILNGLNMDVLGNKLGYLTESERSMLTKDDFRTVNRDMVEADRTLSALAGKFGEDVQSLQTRLSRPPRHPYYELYNTPPASHFKELAKRGNLKYLESAELNTLGELNVFITRYLHFMDSRSFILTESAPGVDEVTGAYIMKIKKRENSFPDHEKLLIDYKQPGFLARDTPNPFRFTTFIRSPFNNFKIYLVNVMPHLIRD